MQRSMRLTAMVIITVACASLPGSAALTQAPRAVESGGELMDYLVQDVCIDATGLPVAGDPASCSRHRNLQVGERLPYLVTDYDRSVGRSHSSMSSVPAIGVDGKLKVVVVKSLEGGYGPDYSFTFSGARDAFDLIDVSNSGYASIVRTFDGGCFDQIFSRSNGTRNLSARAGGWILFPLDRPPSGWAESESVPLTTWRMQVKPAGPRCADNHATGLTAWARPQSLTFESGKALSAIRSDHFAAVDLAQAENSFERFFFTREYGMTRWESWWTRAHCERTLGGESPRCRPEVASAPLRPRCSVLTLPGEPIAGLERRGGQSWVRMDCRDMTRYLPLRRPQLLISRQIGADGGIIDIDYAATLAKVR